MGSPGEGMGLVGDAGPMQLKRKRTGEEEEAAVASAGAAAGAGAGAGGVGGGAEWDVSLRGPRRGATLEVGMGGMKKGRVIWDKHLHQQFVSAVKKLGVDSACSPPLPLFLPVSLSLSPSTPPSSFPSPSPPSYPFLLLLPLVSSHPREAFSGPSRMPALPLPRLASQPPCSPLPCLSHHYPLSPTA